MRRIDKGSALGIALALGTVYVLVKLATVWAIVGGA